MNYPIQTRVIVFSIIFLLCAMNVVTSKQGIVPGERNLYGSPPVEVWNKTYSYKSTDHACGHCIRVIPDGGYIVIGYSGGTNQYRFYLLKVDEQGNEVWNRTFGCGYIEGNWVEVTSDNGFIITGRTEDYADSYDVWLIKTNMSGIEEWNRTIGGMQNEWGTCVKQLDSGQYVVAGYSSNGPFLMKTDYLGNVIWTKTYEGCKFESFGLTNDGGFIVVGQKNYCMFLMKTDGNGTEMWEDTYFPVPSPGSTVGTAVQQTKDEGFIVSGMITNLGGWMLLLKTNENGFEEWNTSFHGGVAFCVIQMTNDDYVIGGYWLPHQLETHFWMIQTDTHGGVIWNQTYMPSRFANCYSLQQTPDNGIIATGITDPYGGLSKCVVLKLVNENQQPNTPIIDGPTSCKPKITNQWNFTSNDPNGDDIFYQIDWSDGTPVTEWYGPYHSGETMSQSHSYNTKGTYTIKAKAKDIYGMESDWGTHPITVPCSYNIDTMQFWIQLFERFPHAFPILRQLLKY